MKINILAALLLAGTMFTSCCTTAQSKGKAKKDKSILQKKEDVNQKHIKYNLYINYYI